MKKKSEMICPEGDDPRVLVSKKFIKNNGLSLARAQEEIVSRANGSNSFMGNDLDVLIEFLELDNAIEFFTDEAKEKYKDDPTLFKYTDTVEEAAQDFLDYMVFAWMKARDERGLSASRSIEKLGEWLWLLGRDDLCKIIHDDGLYNPYGAPALINVCKALGIKVPSSLIEFSKNKC